jgi:acyl carrier protein
VEILKDNIPMLEGSTEKILKQDLKSLQVNSLNFIKIVVTIEDAFDIEFEDSQFNQEFFGKIENIVDIITKKLDEKL